MTDLKIALDAGHGIYTPGKRSPADEREWRFNNSVLLACEAELRKYKNVQILRLDDPTGKRDVPLRERTNKANAWKADVLVSIHHNALHAVWGSHGGVETFVHPTGRRSSYDLANIIQPLITKAMGLRNRGVKQKNLHMVRESNMTAILTEGGFMDSTTDIGTLRNQIRLRAQGEAIAEGLVKYYKLTPKSNTGAPTAPEKEGGLTVSQYNELKKMIQNIEKKLGSDREVSASFKTQWDWAVEKGFLDGTRPSHPVTREQLSAILYRYHMDNSLTGTAKKDLTELLQKAYAAEDVFEKDHSPDVENMPAHQILNLIASFINRTYKDVT